LPKKPSDEIIIERMEEGDLDEIIEIEKRSFPAPWSRNLFRETLSSPFSINLVARKKVDKGVVGYANFYLIGNEVQVLNIAIKPESRNRGYGSQFLSHAIGLLKAQGAEDFYLEVREGNSHAIRLYETLGFERIGKRKGYYPETKEDAIVMRLKIGRASDQ
jgi:ribosomal-protein-alanine N-acetyltransferase